MQTNIRVSDVDVLLDKVAPLPITHPHFFRIKIWKVDEQEYSLKLTLL